MGKKTNTVGSGSWNTVVRRLLRPVVRFCLKRTLLAAELETLLRGALIDVAQEMLEERGEESNISRLAVVTGLSRRQVKSFLENSPAENSSGGILMRVIGQWQVHPDFLDRNGKPRALEMTGEESEFADLVRSVTADVSPYTVLFGLEHAGAVRRNAKHVSLVRDSFVVSDDAAAGFSMLAADCNDLIAAVETNLLDRPSIPNFHLTTEYDNISQEELDNLREWLLEEGATFHEKLRTHLGRRDLDANPRLHAHQGGVRVVFGSFSRVLPPISRSSEAS